MAGEPTARRVALEPTERRAGVVLAAVAAVAFVAIDTAWWFVGVALAGLFAVAVWRNNRLAAAGAAVLVGFGPWEFFYVFGLVYVAFALWLLMRGRRGSD